MNAQIFPNDLPIVLAPINVNQIEIVCPKCGKGGVWAFPEAFQIQIRGLLVVTCSNGHQWGIYRAWAEEEGAGHDGAT